MLCNAVLTLYSMPDEILKCDYLSERYTAAVFGGTVKWEVEMFENLSNLCSLSL